jgi:hypothetical protein
MPGRRYDLRLNIELPAANPISTESCEYVSMDVDYSPQALSWAVQLVRAYTDSVDGDIDAELASVLDEVGDVAELRNLLASLAGLTGHAVMVISAQLDAKLAVDNDPERQLERLAEWRTNVLEECALAVHEFRPASMHFLPATDSTGVNVLTERRSGFDRRLGTDRRLRAPGNPSERINLQLYGERRVGVTDRRGGVDRRQAFGDGAS